MKKIASVLLSSFLLMSVASAKQVMVDGVGFDKDSAVRDAMRNAVENVVGTYVDSRTLVENSVVSLDEIYAKSQGFVKDIQILNESNNGYEYQIKAQIDVDTNPDAKLMSKLNMIMMLNDPRIAVIIRKKTIPTNSENMYSEPVDENDALSETLINEKLIEMGFKHVVDAPVVAKLKKIAVLNSLYSGNSEEFEESGNYGVDYLVLGTSHLSASKIELPDGQGGYAASLLTTGRAQLTVKLIKFDTGEIVSTYVVDGQAADNSDVFAQNKAIKVAAEKACVELEKKFKKLAAQPFSGVQFTITASDDTLVDEIVKNLRKNKSVNGVIVRERNGEKTVLDVDSSQKPHMLIRSLKNNTDMGIFVENISGSSVEVVVS